MNWFRKAKIQPPPPAPTRLPDADEKYRLLRIAVITENTKELGWVTRVAPPDTWQLQRYVEPRWYEATYSADRRWLGNSWEKVCDIVGKDLAVETLRIFKSKEEVLYWGSND